MISDHLGNVRVRFADLNGLSGGIACLVRIAPNKHGRRSIPSGDGEINTFDKGPGQEKELLGSYHYYPYGLPGGTIPRYRGILPVRRVQPGDEV